MPNWCENRLSITGSTEGLNHFQSMVQGKHPPYVLSQAEIRALQKPGANTEIAPILSFTFHALVPVPAELLSIPYGEGGNIWQSENWGTKGEATGVRLLSSREEGLVYTFLTAWSSPDKWVKKVSALFPSLSFELAYCEIGTMFAGMAIYEKGEAIEEEIASHDMDSMQFIMIEKLGYSKEDTDDLLNLEEMES